MDTYIAKFMNYKSDCKVIDYCVYLIRHTGFSSINPFAPIEQLVLYLTDKGGYQLNVKSMGEFTQPQKCRGLIFTNNGKRVTTEDSGKSYKYVRKMKNGCCTDFQDFSERFK